MRLRALGLAAALLLSGCAVESESEPSPTSTEQIGEQQLSWYECDPGFECADMTVPLDWTSDGEQFIEIAMIRKAGTQNLTPILVNPGGPGSSGVDFVINGYDSLGSEYLRENFQIVGFDPRGVGRSEPVTCRIEETKDRLLYEHVDLEFGSAEYLEYVNTLYQEFAADCQYGGVSTGYFNTQQTARDMDLLRQLLGLEQLNYLGFSYGTELGANYAALFPERVGLFILDGAVDPELDPSLTLVGQIKGFDKALTAYLEDCLQQNFCPFDSDVETAKQKISNFLRARETKPLPTFDDRDLALQAAIAGIIVTLYSQESWQYLSQAFDEAFSGNGSTFLLLADFYNDRNPDGGYISNITEANYAIACADAVLWESTIDVSAEIAAASSVFGRYFATDDTSCDSWPDGIGLQNLDFSIPLANAPLIIGTTGDPATPYEQAVSLSELLNGAYLVTFEGEGHTAYGTSSCVDKIVDDYLAGNLPSKINSLCS